MRGVFLWGAASGLRLRARPRDSQATTGSGVSRINTGIRQQLARVETGVTLGGVARKDFTIVREDDVVFDIITRMSRRDAAMALVIAASSKRTIPRPHQIRGVITKHVADSVAETVSIFRANYNGTQLRFFTRETGGLSGMREGLPWSRGETRACFAAVDGRNASARVYRRYPLCSAHRAL